MDTLINANPTVFAPSQQSIRKSKTKRSVNMWMDYDSDDVSDDEPEPIDEQEVFGTFECRQTAAPH